MQIPKEWQSLVAANDSVERQRRMALLACARRAALLRAEVGLHDPGRAVALPDVGGVACRWRAGHILCTPPLHAGLSNFISK